MNKHLLKAGGLALIASFALAACNQNTQETATDTAEQQVVDQSELIAAESQKANDFFEEAFEQALARSPEFLTYLGRKERMGEWDDLSQAFADESLELTKQRRKELKQINRD